MDTRATIDSSMGSKDAMDLCGKFAIFSLVSAGWASAPVIIATDTDAQHATHGTDRIELSVVGNEGIA